MPRPANAIQRPDLGQIAFEYYYAASQRGFIGLEHLPIFEVGEQSAEYPVIPMESILKLPETKRAPRGNYNRSDYKFETENYSCHEHGWEEPLDDVEAKLYKRFFDAEEIATLRAVDILLRSQEVRIASKLFDTSNLSNTAVSAAWSDAANADTRGDVNKARKNMRDETGLVPDALTVSWNVFQNILLTNELKEAFKYTNPIEIGGFEAQKRVLSQYYGVNKILVGDSIKDSAKKGKSKNLEDIWSDGFALLSKTAKSKDLREPSLGRTFLWTEDSPSNLVTESYREEQTRSDIYRVRHNVDECFVFKGTGYLLTGVTA